MALKLRPSIQISILCFAPSFLSACTSEIPLALPEGAALHITTETFDPNNGVRHTTFEVPSSSDEYKCFKNWLSQNQKGWHTVYWTRDPNGVLVEVSGGPRLVFQKNMVFVPENGGGELFKNPEESDSSDYLCFARQFSRP